MSGRPGTWLVTGGAGYIGAHVVRTLSEAGLPVVVVDNLSTGVRRRLMDGVPFIHADCSDAGLVHEVLLGYSVSGVIHLAAFKQARESVREPVRYWGNNIGAMLGVIEAIEGTLVRHFVLSSSCSIYGAAGPVDSRTRANPMSPYARTKHVSEELLSGCAPSLGLSWLALRYFNVIGNADFPSAQDTSAECVVPATAARLLRGEQAVVYGADFPTPDGTALRDYVDVRDLASAHLAAAQHLTNGSPSGRALDVGTGAPRSVLEVLTAVHDALGQPMTFRDGGRNPADPDAVWAQATTIRTLLGWSPEHDLQASVRAHVRAVKSKDELVEAEIVT